MYIDRLLFPIHTLGPGNRLVIWTRGCKRHCPGCANPELWDTAGAKNISPADLFQITANIHRETPADGITISGGDPFDQLPQLLEYLELCRTLRPAVDDILVYTGADFDILSQSLDPETLRRIHSNIDVLIDGPYIEEQNFSDLVLRGSANQRILFFREFLKARYEPYLAGRRQIENVYMGSQLISVGIHNRQTDDTNNGRKL